MTIVKASKKHPLYEELTAIAGENRVNDNQLIISSYSQDAVIDYDIEGDRFHLVIGKKGQVVVHPIRAENADIELTFSKGQ